MPSARAMRRIVSALVALAWSLSALPSHAQAALLLEQPYGFFGVLAPTGHNAIYFERICPETPVKLRRCRTGELGSVLSRYQGIADYDWVAIPLIPYLYSVDELSEIPARVTKSQVHELRLQYHDAHLNSLGEGVGPGGAFTGGWTELIGVAYDRRIFVYRFQTTEEQDEALIEQFNSEPNRTHFEFFFNNCSDFTRKVLNHYFPGGFRRAFFPDMGMTTPKQTASRLARYARKHKDVQLKVYEIPQTPGYRRESRANLGVAESLTTTAYVVPIAMLNPYVAGGIFADYLVRGRFHTRRSQIEVLSPSRLPELAGLPTAPPAVPVAPSTQSAAAAAPSVAPALNTAAPEQGKP